MERAVVVGAPGSIAPKVASRLADALGCAYYSSSAGDAGRAPGVVVAASLDPESELPELVVYIDDSPAPKSGRSPGRESDLAALASAQAGGAAAAILGDWDTAKRWLRHLRDEGAPPARPLQRVFVAAASTPESRQAAESLVRALSLPVLHPDDDGNITAEGWGRHYANAAAGDRWVAQSASWHAVEYLAGRADAVIALPGKPGHAPEPEQRTWRVIFGAWFKRYPRIESGLLARTVAAHAHLAPVYRIRNEHELQAVVAGFSGIPAATA